MVAALPWSDAHPPALHTLHPGDVVCAERGDRLETLLGSCVAIVMSDRARTMAAMCHIVHCQPPLGGDVGPTTAAGAAIDRLYHLIRLRGLNPCLCEAFVFGGANMFPNIYPRSHVGEGNVRAVLRRLAADGVRVVGENHGGNAYRRVSWVIGDDPPAVFIGSVPGVES